LTNNDWSDEETDNPLLADDRNFYKVEKWTKDGTTVDRLLYAGNNLDRAHIRRGRQAPAPDQADHPAADARVAAVAEGDAVGATNPCQAIRASAIITGACHRPN
jgi:hypothetical protein